MGTKAGYITVDWEKVDQDMRHAGEHVNQKIVEHQRNEETQDLIQKVCTFMLNRNFREINFHERPT